MPSSRRCIFGCVTKGLTVHSFPNPAKFPEQFKTWVELGGDQLKNLSVEDIYPRLKVCDKHFIESHRNRNNRLNALAVPTLHLSLSQPEPDVGEASDKVLPTEDNTYLSTDMPIDQVSKPEPDIGEASNKVLQTEGSTELSTDMAILSLDEGLHATQSVSLEGEERSVKHNMPKQNIFFSALHLSDAVNRINNDHDYCGSGIVEPSTSKQIHRKPPVTKKKQGSKNKIYYKEPDKKIRNLRREILRLRKNSKSLKSRLEAVQKLSDSAAFQRVTASMTLPAKLFTAMQFREARKKPKGHRFTLEEKNLCVSLYKRSPKAYTLLNKSFTLPSSKSLRNLLSRIKIGPGINNLIFKKMRDTVADMEEDDRLCILMFDEMSINAQVHYDSNIDVLKGFSTIGQKTKIADHADQLKNSLSSL